MKNVIIFTLNYCPFCKKAKKILRDRNIPFEEIDITNNEEAQTKVIADKYNIDGEVTFPQIIIGDTRIGGSDNLEQLIRENKLDELLKED